MPCSSSDSGASGSWECCSAYSLHPLLTQESGSSSSSNRTAAGSLGIISSRRTVNDIRSPTPDNHLSLTPSPRPSAIYFDTASSSVGPAAAPAFNSGSVGSAIFDNRTDGSYATGSASAEVAPSEAVTAAPETTSLAAAPAASANTSFRNALSSLSQQLLCRDTHSQSDLCCATSRHADDASSPQSGVLSKRPAAAATAAATQREIATLTELSSMSPVEYRSALRQQCSEKPVIKDELTTHVKSFRRSSLEKGKEDEIVNENSIYSQGTRGNVEREISAETAEVALAGDEANNEAPAVVVDKQIGEREILSELRFYTPLSSPADFSFSDVLPPLSSNQHVQAIFHKLTGEPQQQRQQLQNCTCCGGGASRKGADRGGTALLVCPQLAPGAAAVDPERDSTAQQQVFCSTSSGEAREERNCCCSSTGKDPAVHLLSLLPPTEQHVHQKQQQEWSSNANYAAVISGSEVNAKESVVADTQLRRRNEASRDFPRDDAALSDERDNLKNPLCRLPTRDVTEHVDRSDMPVGEKRERRWLTDNYKGRSTEATSNSNSGGIVSRVRQLLRLPPKMRHRDDEGAKGEESDERRSPSIETLSQPPRLRCQRPAGWKRARITTMNALPSLRSYPMTQFPAAVDAATATTAVEPVAHRVLGAANVGRRHIVRDLYGQDADDEKLKGNVTGLCESGGEVMICGLSGAAPNAHKETKLLSISDNALKLAQCSTDDACAKSFPLQHIVEEKELSGEQRLLHRSKKRVNFLRKECTSLQSGSLSAHCSLAADAASSDGAAALDAAGRVGCSQPVTGQQQILHNNPSDSEGNSSSSSFAYSTSVNNNQRLGYVEDAAAAEACSMIGGESGKKRSIGPGVCAKFQDNSSEDSENSDSIGQHQSTASSRTSLLLPHRRPELWHSHAAAAAAVSASTTAAWGVENAFEDEEDARLPKRRRCSLLLWGGGWKEREKAVVEASPSREAAVAAEVPRARGSLCKRPVEVLSLHEQLRLQKRQHETIQKKEMPLQTQHPENGDIGDGMRPFTTVAVTPGVAAGPLAPRPFRKRKRQSGAKSAYVTRNVLLLHHSAAGASSEDAALVNSLSSALSFEETQQLRRHEEEERQQELLRQQCEARQKAEAAAERLKEQQQAAAAALAAAHPSALPSSIPFVFGQKNDTKSKEDSQTTAAEPTTAVNNETAFNAVAGGPGARSSPLLYGAAVAPSSQPTTTTLQPQQQTQQVTQDSSGQQPFQLRSNLTAGGRPKLRIIRSSAPTNAQTAGGEAAGRGASLALSAPLTTTNLPSLFKTASAAGNSSASLQQHQRPGDLPAAFGGGGGVWNQLSVPPAPTPIAAATVMPASVPPTQFGGAGTLPPEFSSASVATTASTGIAIPTAFGGASAFGVTAAASTNVAANPFAFQRGGRGSRGRGNARRR